MRHPYVVMRACCKQSYDLQNRMKVLFLILLLFTTQAYARKVGYESRQVRNSKLMNWKNSGMQWMSSPPLSLFGRKNNQNWKNNSETKIDNILKEIATSNEKELVKFRETENNISNTNTKLIARIIKEKERNSRENTRQLSKNNSYLKIILNNKQSALKKLAIEQNKQTTTVSEDNNDNSKTDNGQNNVLLREKNTDVNIFKNPDNILSDIRKKSSANKGKISKNENKRCVKKVMQITETQYDNKIQCHHSYDKKCHNTFITDYVPTMEKKCETSFKKNCHISYKPVMFSEKVELCSEPLQKVCSNSTVGEEICRIYYETSCETRYNKHEVIQDVPSCVTVMEPDCQGRSYDSLSHGEKCEQWPVQKCILEKKLVKKLSPDTSCRKTPRKICASSNCEMKKREKVCRTENRDLVQNIPEEDCNLEPQEDCKMETVLVPRLVQKKRCLKVPKEVCFHMKVNPRKVKKPVIKEWCYNPEEFKNKSSRKSFLKFSL